MYMDNIVYMCNTKVLILSVESKFSKAQAIIITIFMPNFLEIRYIDLIYGI